MRSGRTVARLALTLCLTAVPIHLAPHSAAAPPTGPAPTVSGGIGMPEGYTPPAPVFGVGYELGRLIPLSDGTQLTAAVRYPTDPATGLRAPGPFPVVVNWTTYGSMNGVLTAVATSIFDLLHIDLPDNVKDVRRVLNQATGMQDSLVSRGYIEVTADVRGTGSSPGEWDPASRQDGLDGNEVVEWAARLPGSNGRVGMFGYSFPAASALFTAETSRPGTPLRAMLLHDVPADLFADVLGHGGMFSPILLTVVVPLVQYMSVVWPLYNLPLTPQVAVQALVDHLRGALFSPETPLLKVLDGWQGGTFAHKDEWWAARDFGPGLKALVDNDIATYFVNGGWDLYQDAGVHNYAQLQNLAAGRPQYGPMPATAIGDPRFQLLQGPWSHLENGAGPYARMDTDAVTIAWFDHWLKGIDNGVDAMPGTLHMIDQTARGTNTTAYPFAGARTRTYDLGPGTLSDTPAAAPPDRLPYTLFDNPCNRENFEQWTAGFVQALLNLVQVEDPCAADVRAPQSGLTYTGDPVAAPTLVAGPGTLHVFVSPSADQAALQVFLEDVAPDGGAVHITGGAQLATLRTLDEEKTWRTADGTVYSAEVRQSSADVLPVTAGQIVDLAVRIRPAYYRLEAGHRLRLRITTGNFPSSFAPPKDVPALWGSSFDLLHDAAHPSRLTISLAPATP
ncbi:CocE/NonD family hydrolase [Nocardia sp. NPDC059240]|uniref:CocE/NonD family hydrolase n=1 Tax=Nocardia sp. NPDC059240 TaxID=3346786 RepID=UPI0036CC2CF1